MPYEEEAEIAGGDGAGSRIAGGYFEEHCDLVGVPAQRGGLACLDEESKIVVCLGDSIHDAVDNAGHFWGWQGVECRA